MSTDAPNPTPAQPSPSSVGADAHVVLLDTGVNVPAGVGELQAFRRWSLSKEFPEQGRIDFLAGRIEIDMSANELHAHCNLKCAVLITLMRIVDSDDVGEVLGGRLASREGDFSTTPDAMVIRHEDYESDRVRLTPKPGCNDRFVEVHGAPSVVVEIVGDCSEARDYERLPARYFAAGVLEYWLLDGRSGADLQILRRGERAFALVDADDERFRRSDVLRRRFQLQRNKNRFDHWIYTLHSRN